MTRILRTRSIARYWDGLTAPAFPASLIVEKSKKSWRRKNPSWHTRNRRGNPTSRYPPGGCHFEGQAKLIKILSPRGKLSSSSRNTRERALGTQLLLLKVLVIALCCKTTPQNAFVFAERGCCYHVSNQASSLLVRNSPNQSWIIVSIIGLGSVAWPRNSSEFATSITWFSK